MRVQAKDPQEILAHQSEYVKKQLAAMEEHAKELGTCYHGLSCWQRPPVNSQDPQCGGRMRFGYNYPGVY